MLVVANDVPEVLAVKVFTVITVKAVCADTESRHSRTITSKVLLYFILIVFMPPSLLLF